MYLRQYRFDIELREVRNIEIDGAAEIAYAASTSGIYIAYHAISCKSSSASYSDSEAVCIHASQNSRKEIWDIHRERSVLSDKPCSRKESNLSLIHSDGIRKVS